MRKAFEINNKLAGSLITKDADISALAICERARLSFFDGVVHVLSHRGD